ncbi:MAG TPA: DJ-1/PfpI family protein [Gammaproteobacteria bacterium]
MKKRTVAILVYDGVEVLDFAGPFEVFAVTSELNDDRFFDVRLVAADAAPVTTINGMRVLANSRFEEMPAPDLLVVAGGSGSRQAMHDPLLLDWTRNAARTAEAVLGICSGARILAALGMLDGREATTHHQVFEHVREIAPAATLRGGVRFIDTGRIITTGGISAGIDGSFHLVARLLGVNIAVKSAEYMEYAWVPDASHSYSA